MRDRQSALTMSKLLCDATAEFKNHHFAIVDQIKNDDDVKAEQEILDDHELRVMDLIDRPRQLVEVPPPPAPPSPVKPIASIELLRRRIDDVEQCYRKMKEEFDERGHSMDTISCKSRRKEYRS